MGRYSDAEVQAYIDKVKAAQGKTNTSGGTGGAGYNPNANENVGKALEDINSGNFKNNPNQGYIDFGKSGVLGKQDWINQNGIDTEDNSINVDERYQQYLGDYAKQNNINTEGLDLANWEQHAQQGNDWQNPYEGLDTENSIYTYIQQMLDEGKISDEDATYLANALTNQGVVGADGSYLDLASGWADSKAKKEAERDSEWLKNWGGVTADANEINDESTAIFNAMRASEITNQDDLFAAVDEWADGKNPDLVRSMMETLDSSLAEYGIPSMTEAYMQHYSNGQANAPAPTATEEIADIDEAFTGENGFEAKLREEAKSKGKVSKEAQDEYVKDQIERAVSKGNPELEKLKEAAKEAGLTDADEIDDYVYNHLGDVSEDAVIAYYWNRREDLRQVAADEDWNAFNENRYDSNEIVDRMLESGSYEETAPAVVDEITNGNMDGVIEQFVDYMYPQYTAKQREQFINQFHGAAAMAAMGDKAQITKLPYFPNLVEYVMTNGLLRGDATL